MPKDPSPRDVPPPSSTIGHVARARDGDPFAWDTLEDKLRKMLTEAFGKERMPASYAVDDLINDTWLDVLRGLGGFSLEAGSSFRAWVMRIAQNNLKDRFRYDEKDRRKPPGLVHLDAPMGDTSGVLGDRVADPDAHRPSMHARRDELSAAFWALVKGLRKEARTIVELRIFHELPFEEIMHKVGRNKVDTVKAIFHRTMAKLRGELGGHA